MRWFKSAPGAVISSNDQAGNVWPEPMVFDDNGYLGVPDDQQDVIVALEGACARGSVKRAEAPPSRPKRRE